MLRSILYWITQKRWLLFAIVLGTVLYHLPYPQGISNDGYRTLIIAIIVIILIISEAVPLPGIALLIAVLQVVFAIANPSEVARSFMSDAVFFIMGSLMLAVAIVKQGLSARITLGILKLTGNRVTRIVWGLFIISLVLSSFIGEHAVVAMLIPVAMSLIRNTTDETDPIPQLTVLLLITLAFGSMIGSTCTPSGGARNAIMINYLTEFGLAKISYSKWLILAYPIALLQIPFAGWLLLRTFKPEQQVLDRAVRKLKVQVAHAGSFTGEQILAVILFGIIVLAWVTMSDRIGMGIIALAGVFLYIATGLVQWPEINQRTNWGVVLLFAAAISLGVQLKNTGAALWLAQNLLSGTGQFFERWEIFQYALNIGVTTVVVNILSSSATVAVLGPFFMNMGGDPVTLGLTTALASSFGYFTSVGSPACMIIFATGLVHAKDLMRVGWKMVLVSGTFLLLAITYYWPLLLK